MKKIICSNCFYRWHFDGDDYCKMIEKEHGGNIIADKTECLDYLKKGTEPKYPCFICKKNAFGEGFTMEEGKTYCQDCWYVKQIEECKKEEVAKDKKQKAERNRKIKELRKILNGDKKKIKQITDLLL